MSSLHAVVPHLRHMVRKPAVILYWLATARAGLLVLAILLTTFPTLMPRAVDTVLSNVYEPVVEKKFFGLIKRETENPLLMPRRQQVGAMVWTTGVAVVLVLLWLHIPRAVERATDKSREREHKADSQLTSDPSHSLLLYRSALAWATHPDHEHRLRAKLESLNDRLSQLLQSEDGVAAHDQLAQPESQQTLVLTASTAQRSRQQRQIIGPRGRYRIEAQIGRGAMGIVHRGHDDVLDRDIAIKELPSHLACDAELISRFQQEARALARLTHPNIVQIYDFLLEPDCAYIAMELIDGVDLVTYIHNSGDDQEAALRLCAQLADALDYAHERGVIHRDFKPANILMSAAGQPKITDFGLAKIAGSGFETLAGTIIGSPAYMSPEQALGKPLDARTDIYSFGVVLYWMTTGRLPFEGNAKEMMDSHINASPVPPAALDATIPTGVNDLVMRLLAKDPASRIASMAAVASLLRNAH